MKYSFYIVAFMLLISCKTGNKTADKNAAKQNERQFQITTDYGVMKGKLYNETPLHRDNFVKLVEQGFYDSLLFHRVINNFMIQGGDPDSKNAEAGAPLGNGGPGYTIPAEFNSQLIHKKGALSAARLGDNVNPEKASSGSQFYIVQGMVYDSVRLAGFEQRMKSQKISNLAYAYLQKPENQKIKSELDSLNRVGNRELLMEKWNKVQREIEANSKEDFGFTPLQYTTYTTVGGTPHLDGGYTVFGEITEGLNVIDSIAQVKGDRANRPLKDVRFTIKMLN